MPGAAAEYGWLSAKAIIKGTQCVKKNLEPNSKFEVRIRGVNDAGSSGWSRITVMATTSDGNSTHGNGTPSSNASEPAGESSYAVRSIVECPLQHRRECGAV